MGSQITLKGASLYDLLGKEVELREKRNNVLARQLEITEVEQALRSSVKTVEDEIKVKFHALFSSMWWHHKTSQKLSEPK